MNSVDIEAPSVAQIHRAAIEKVALRLADGELPRRAFAGLPLGGMSESERSELMVAATVRARELIARNQRRNRILGLVWCVCGLIPLVFFTIHWFRHGRWSLLLLIIGAPALLKGYRVLSLKRTQHPDLD
jgi:4-amino-4-deoxy-L-arabinose transferase-like glycosyltransferase